MKPTPALSSRSRDDPAQRQAFETEVLQGLQKPAKVLPCKYFYNERGSTLFEEICRLEEYYLTRTELEILEHNIEDMTACLGSGCLLIELGSGSGRKTCLLLDHLSSPAGYVPVDIARESLAQSAQAMRSRYPGLLVWPLCVDFTAPFSL